MDQRPKLASTWYHVIFPNVVDLISFDEMLFLVSFTKVKDVPFTFVENQEVTIGE